MLHGGLQHVTSQGSSGLYRGGTFREVGRLFFMEHGNWAYYRGGLYLDVLLLVNDVAYIDEKIK